MSYFNIHKGSFWRSRGDQPLLYWRRLRTLEKSVGRPGSLLDVGSGEGFFAMRAERRGWMVTAIDGLTEGVESTRAKLVNGRAESGDAQSLNFDDESFEAVVAWDLLEHLERPEEAMSEMARVLKPRGVLAFSTPNTAARSVVTRGRDSIQYRDLTHVSLDLPTTWLGRLRAVGLQPESVGTDAYWDPPYPGHWVPNLILRAHAQATFALRFNHPRRTDGENLVVLARKPVSETRSGLVK